LIDTRDQVVLISFYIFFLSCKQLRFYHLKYDG